MGVYKFVEIEFDPDKDERNLAKHGVSLARTAELDIRAVEHDARFAPEMRFRAFGLLDGRPYCLAFVLRGSKVRPISLRRAHEKEYRRRVEA